MASFPGVEDLGPTPAVATGRAVAGYNPRPMQQAGEQLGAGVERSGQGIGEYGDLEARYQFMTAHADYLTKSIDLQNSFANDQDYSTLSQRYQAAAEKLRDDTAQTIASPGLRERFVSSANENIARGTSWADDRSAKLSNGADIAAVTQRGQALANTFAATQDQGQREQIIGTYGALVDALQAKGAITPLQAISAKHQWAHQLATADVLSRIQNGDAGGVLNELRAAPSSDEQIDNRTIQLESAGNPLARAASGHALGLGQFEPATWLTLMRQAHPELANLPDSQVLALRADPGLSREMVALNRQQNTAYLQGKGIEATPGNIYLAHFLGPAGAAAVLQSSPNVPVDAVLSKAVGADTAAKMIAGNPSILQGKTAGTVAQWASEKMGGVGPGGGHLYDLLQPDERAELETRAENALNKQTIDDQAQFGLRVANAESEAFVTGQPSQPISREEFVARYGADRGSVEFAKYDSNIQKGRAIAGMVTMTADERAATVNSLMPQPGDPDYALKLQAYQVATQSADQLDKEFGVGKYAGTKDADPAGASVARLPASQERFSNFAQTLANPTATPGQRADAAQSYAETTLLDQKHFGVPADQQRVAPKSYIDNLNKTLTAAASAEDPQARTKLIGQIQGEAAMWGKYWPDVMRQLAPASQPVVRAIAAGADPQAMTRLLSLPVDEAKRPAAILQQANGAKFTDLTNKLNDAMAPFRSTLIGRQLDRDYPGYYHLATELAALYMRDGQDAETAATKAFSDLVGSRYDFVDSYRIPKSAGLNPLDVQAGVQDVKARLGSFNIAPAGDDLGLGASANRADSISKFARDGKWVTNADNTGLSLVYDGKFVRSTDGTPFTVTFPQLANLGSHARSGPAPTDVGTRRENAARRGVESGAQ